MQFSANYEAIRSGDLTLYRATGNVGDRKPVSPDVSLSTEEQVAAATLLAQAPSLTVEQVQTLYRIQWALSETDVGIRPGSHPMGLMGSVTRSKLDQSMGSVSLQYRHRQDRLNTHLGAGQESTLAWLNGKTYLTRGQSNAAQFTWTSHVHRDAPTALPTNLLRLLLSYPVVGDAKLRLADQFESTGSAFLMGNSTAYCLLTDMIDTTMRVAFYLKWALMHVRPLEFSLLVADLLTEDTEVSPELQTVAETFRATTTWQRHVSRFGEREPMRQRYPDSHPAHPSLPGGHAAVGYGALEALKLIFEMNDDEELRLSNWAYNLGWARAVGGIHWPMDITYAADIAAAVVPIVADRHGLAL